MHENPLKQYFRRPAIYIKLPSDGKYYEPGVINFPENKEIPVYPMTAIDEVTSRTPDAVFNGHAVADIIKSCVPCIIDPWRINSVDLDALIIAIKVASVGEELEIGSTCNSCKSEGKYSINLVSLLNEQTKIDYDQVLKIRDLEIRFKPLTYSESNKNNLSQYEIQKTLFMLENIEDQQEKKTQMNDAVKQLNNIIHDAIASTIAYIKTPESVVNDSVFIKEFLDNCDRQTNIAIKEYSVDIRNKNQIKPVRLKCMNCQSEYQQQVILNLTDFFA